MPATAKQVPLVVLHERVPESVMFGGTPAMQAIRREVERLAGTNTPVLIQGENGTGKEVLANLIHSRSCGKSGAFVRFTCPAIHAGSRDGELLAETLTGSQDSGPNREALAQKTTLFFDDISELHPMFQAKLLQFLQDSWCTRGRESLGRTAETQVICSTNRDLEAEVHAKRFRQDLLYRVNVITITLPPLRQRAEDIPIISEHLLRTYCTKHNVQFRTFTPQLLELMQRYHWPGNIRELENLVRRFVILGSEQVIGSELLAKVSADFHPEESWGNGISLKTLTRQAALELERRVILKALENNGWNRKRTARSLNISYRALLYKIKQGGMPPKRSLPPRGPAQIP